MTILQRGEGSKIGLYMALIVTPKSKIDIFLDYLKWLKQYSIVSIFQKYLLNKKYFLI